MSKKTTIQFINGSIDDNLTDCECKYTLSCHVIDSNKECKDCSRNDDRWYEDLLWNDWDYLDEDIYEQMEEWI